MREMSPAGRRQRATYFVNFEVWGLFDLAVVLKKRNLEINMWCTAVSLLRISSLMSVDGS